MGSRSECPKCGAKRGLAEYDNGEYCHACHEFTGLTKSLIKRLDVQTQKKELELPKCKPAIWPEEAKEWIYKYLEPKEAIVPYFWSDEYQRIVFPSNCGKAAWMRRVEETNRPEYKPKWLFVGDKEVVFKYGERRNHSYGVIDSVCLVEDVISAIKVSEVMDCIALGGTQIKDNVYSYIGDSGYSKVYVFLDGDEAGRKGAEFIRKRLALLYDTIIIRGNKDPKEMSLDQIKDLLNV